jgi:hypothetical protein
MELKEVEKLNNVMNSQQYSGYKEYSIATKVVSKKDVYYKYIPTGTQFLYDMEIRDASNCINMPFCRNTDTRENRVPNVIDGTNYQPKPSRPIALKKIKMTTPEKVNIMNNINCKCAFT